jgi:hypothetical protein
MKNMENRIPSSPTIINDLDELLTEQRKLYFEEQQRIKAETDRRGETTERRVFDAFKALLKSEDKPEWLHSIEEPIFLDDHAEKIDLWIITDIGRLGVQIKTSKKYEQKFIMGKKGMIYHPDIYTMVVPSFTRFDCRSALNRAYAFQRVRGVDGFKRKEGPRPLLPEEKDCEAIA